MQQYYKRTFAIPVEYKGITFRSKLERDFALYLDGELISHKNERYLRPPIKWEYEAHEFELAPQEKWVDKTEIDTTVKKIKRNKKHTLQRVIYTPDFYLPDLNLYVECKGFQFDDALFALRFRWFKRVYPNVAIWKVTSHADFPKLDEVIGALKIGEK